MMTALRIDVERGATEAMVTMEIERNEVNSILFAVALCKWGLDRVRLRGVEHGKS
jgi:hypothetical protein